MKKLYLKKFLSLFLTLAMCLSLATTALAAGDDPDTEEPDLDIVRVEEDEKDETEKSVSVQNDEGKEDEPEEPKTSQDLKDDSNNLKDEVGTVEELGETAEEMTKPTPGEANTADSNAKDATEEAKKLEEPVEEIKQAVTDSNNELNGQELSDILGAVEGINQVVSDVQDETNEKIGELNTSTTETVQGDAGIITDAESKVEGISADVDDKLQAAKDKLEAAQAEGATEEDKQAAIDAAQLAVDTAKEAQTEAEAEKTKAENAVTEAKNAVAKAKEDYDKLLDAAKEKITQQTKEYQDKIEAAQQRLSNALEELTDANNARDEAEKQAGILANKVNAATKQQAETAKTDAEAAHEAAKTARDEAQETIRKAEENIAAIDQMVRDLEAEKVTAAEGSEEKSTALENAQSDLQEKKDELAAAKKVLDSDNRSDLLNSVTEETAKVTAAAGSRENASRAFLPKLKGWAKDEFVNKQDAVLKAESQEEQDRAWNDFHQFVLEHIDNYNGYNHYDTATKYAALKGSMKLEIQAKADLATANNKLTQYDQAERDFKELPDVIKALDGEIRDLNAYFTGLEQTLIRLDDEIRGLTETRGDTNGVLERAKATEAQAKLDVDTTQEAAQKAQAAIEALEKAEKKLEDARRAQAAYDQAKADVLELQRKVYEALKARNDPEYDKLADQDELQENVKSLEAELVIAQQKADQAKQDAEKKAEEAQKALDDANAIEIPTTGPVVGPEGPEDDGDAGDTGAAGDVADAEDAETVPAEPVPAEQVIEDQLVPLSGLVTRAMFVDYLWRHEGSPEADAPTFADVPADHMFVEALGWGQANGIAKGDDEEKFRPDDQIDVATVRQMLGDLAAYKGMEMPELTTLSGEDGDYVDNCAEVLAEFFGEEYVDPTADTEIEVAA